MTRILFVDDEPRVLNGLRRALDDMNAVWDMLFKTSGKDTLEEMAHSPVDVLVSDISMPEMSGLELVQRVNVEYPGTQCIILTGTADLRIAEQLINSADVFRFYTKPCDADVLRDGIRAAVRAGSADANGRDGLETALLDRISAGIIVSRPSGEMIYMNKAAASTLANSSALNVDHGKRLAAATSRQTQLLRDSIMAFSEAGPDETGGLRLEDRDLEGGLHLIFSALESEPGVMIFLTDLAGQSLPSAKIVRDLFNLTDAESRLVERLVHGDTVTEAGAALGVTEATARTYLKRILSKLGIGRQVELISRVLSTNLPG